MRSTKDFGILILFGLKGLKISLKIGKRKLLKGVVHSTLDYDTYFSFLPTLVNYIYIYNNILKIHMTRY